MLAGEKPTAPHSIAQHLPLLCPLAVTTVSSIHVSVLCCVIIAMVRRVTMSFKPWAEAFIGKLLELVEGYEK
jgi:hypothetical protein